MPANINFKNPASTASMIVVKEDTKFYEGMLRNYHTEILLVKRKHAPYENMWALPGGFLNCDKESLEDAAVRELQEETSLYAKKEDLELLCVRSDPKRDPRGHVIDHVYLVKKYSGIASAADDAKELKYFPLDALPKLAFDHQESIDKYKLWRRIHD
jgi:8-oxo-dGTP diphosphatase